MSRLHDECHASPFGNPLWLILPRGSYRSPKLVGLSNSFEQSLAKSFIKLKPNATAISLLWLRQALESLFDTHNKIKTLIADLQFPSSSWDEKWIEFYLDDSIKLLDVCLAMISEVSRLDQSQILIRYALRISDFSTSPSTKQLRRAADALHDWMQKLHSRSPKLDNTPSILQELISTLSLPKVKNSAKGKVLARALYAVKAETIFICSILLTVLSGSGKPLVDLQIPKDFLWAESFDDLQATVIGELRNHLLSGKPLVLKELGEVAFCAKNLHERISCLSKGRDKEEEEASRDDIDEAKRRCQEPVLELSKGAKNLAHGLEHLKQQLDVFFDLLMSGRDALLSTLRASNSNERKVRSGGKFTGS